MRCQEKSRAKLFADQWLFRKTGTMETLASQLPSRDWCLGPSIGSLAVVIRGWPRKNFDCIFKIVQSSPFLVEKGLQCVFQHVYNGNGFPTRSPQSDSCRRRYETYFDWWNSAQHFVDSLVYHATRTLTPQDKDCNYRTRRQNDVTVTLV